MDTILTFADYNKPDWGSIDLSADQKFCRAFWAAVLQLATADNAQIVYFRLDDDANCLVVKIDGQTFTMEPPPVEYRQELLAAARRMASGGRLKIVFQAFRRMLNRTDCLGTIFLETSSGEVPWNVYDELRGLRLERT